MKPKSSRLLKSNSKVCAALRRRLCRACVVLHHSNEKRLHARGNSKNRFERFETALSIPHAPVGVAVDLVVDVDALALLAADGVGEHDREVAAVVLKRVCGSSTRRQPARESQCADNRRPPRHEAMSTS